MRKFERFAVSFFSALLVTAAAHAADLRVIKDPAQIDALYPPAASLRVVNIWATWCAPCVAEMPDLRIIDDTFGKEVVLVGISMDNLVPGITKEKVAAFLDKTKIRFANVFYTGKPDAIGDRLNFSGELPVTIVYDRKGKEVWRHEGRLNREQTIARLRELLRRK
jgi:thiol-disulfide isomerase/thioredoxin